MKKILLTGVYNSLNNGGMAVVLGASKTLKNILPDAEIALLSSHPQIDTRRYSNSDIRIIDFWYKKTDSSVTTYVYSSLRAASLMCNSLINRFTHMRFNNIYTDYDVIVDLSCDSLSDYYGRFPLFYFLFTIFQGVIIKRPVIICAASVGPFENKLSKLMAKFVLNKVDLITLREEISNDYLVKTGINKPRIYQTADLAFLMEPAPHRRIEEILANEGIREFDRPLIGITASQLISRYAFPSISCSEEKYNQYINTMIKLTDFLADKLNATIFLVPHGVVPTEDDRIACRKIYEGSKNKDNIKFIKGDYTADELKGIIGLCDMFIGCRMHSTIAATSMCVPTIAIAYSHKFYGVIGKMLNQNKYIVDIRELDPDSLLSVLTSKVNEFWPKRESVRAELREKAHKVQELATFNLILVKEILEKT